MILSIFFFPPYNYSIHGGSLIIIGSLLLARVLFDNYLVENIEKGEVLALAHAGVAFIFTGYVIQNHNYFKVGIAPPREGIPGEYTAWLVIEIFGLIGPFTTVPLIVLMLYICHKFSFFEPEEEMVQTRLDSERWYKNEPDIQYAQPLEYPNTQLIGIINFKEENLDDFTFRLEYNYDDRWEVISQFSHDSNGEFAENVIEEGLKLYSYKEGDRVTVNANFPSIPQYDLRYYCELYLCLHAHTLIRRFEQWHNIEEQESEFYPKDMFLEIPASVVEYFRPNPLSDEYINSETRS